MRCRRRRILLALALSCQGCGLQNWRLWRLRRLCSVMAGGTARPAAAEGEAGHEPGTGWPGPQVAALGRGARAHGRPSRLGIYGEPPICHDGGPTFPRSFRPSNRRKRWIAHVMESAKLEPMFFARFRGFCTVFGFSLFGRVGVYSGISQWYRVGDAGALRAEPLATLLSCAVKRKVGRTSAQPNGRHP